MTLEFEMARAKFYYVHLLPLPMSQKFAPCVALASPSEVKSQAMLLVGA
jgi:hypothetical protein